MDKTQHGLSVSEKTTPLNRVLPGDLITEIDGIPYGQVLGYLFHHSLLLELPRTLTVLSNGDERTIQFRTEPYSVFTLFKEIWPHLLFLAVYLTLGLSAVLKAPRDSVTMLFFLMNCGFSCSIASTLISNAGVFIPSMVSASFLVLTLFNWASFALWAHFISSFPKERDLIERRPWLAASYYFLPPTISIITALALATHPGEFWEWLQRIRNLFLPLIIIGAFFKHLKDYYSLPAIPARNQIKYPLVAYWLSFGPYLFFYLLPNLLFNTPLIHFRTAILAFLLLPLAYLFALMRYRLFDVDKTLSRILAYIITIIGATLLYSGFILVLKRWMWGKGPLTGDLFLIFMIAVIALFNPSVNWLQKHIRSFFLREKPISSSLIKTLSHQITTVIDIAELGRIITQGLPEQLALKRAVLVVNCETPANIYQDRCENAPIAKEELDIVEDLFSDQDELLLYQIGAGLKRESEQLPTSLQGWPLVFRLRGTKSDLGFLFVGEKKSDRLFTYQEINILTTLSNQIGTTLENCIRYEGLTRSKKEQAIIFQKLLQNERLATIGEMTATLAHELKNPLATIRSSAQYVLESSRSFESSKEMLGFIVEEVDIIDKNIRSLLGLAKYRPPELKPVDIAMEICSMVARWRNSKEHRPRIHLVCDVEENLPNLECDINQLNQILFNLIHNAEEAIGDEGVVTIVAQQAGKSLIVRVRDTGPGIPEDQKESLFENFHTTKANGAGLGLSVCRQLAEAHGGTITIRNSSGGGAVAILSLPFQSKSLLHEKYLPALEN